MAIRMSTAFQQAPMRVQDELQDMVLRRGGSQDLARVVLAVNERARDAEDTNRALRATIEQLRAELAAVKVDAERYRFVRDADRSDCITHEIGLYAMESLDEYVDAAMEGESTLDALRKGGQPATQRTEGGAK